MSVSIVEILPNDYELMIHFDTLNDCHLFSKDDSYIISFRHPRFPLTKRLFLKLEANNEELAKYSFDMEKHITDHFDFFEEFTLVLINDITNEMMIGDRSYQSLLPLEYIFIPTIINRITLYLKMRALDWNRTCIILYPLAQILYYTFNVTKIGAINSFTELENKKCLKNDDSNNLSDFDFNNEN